MRLSDETLKGRTVIGADGQRIGVVTEMFVDSEQWRVESIRIELTKQIADQIGATRGLFHRGAIEIPTRLIQSVGDAVVLAVPVAELREVHRLATASEAAPVH